MTTAYSYIRFSSKKQAAGSSLSRQKTAAQEWADINKIPLDTTLNMQDLGLSAYKGTHIEQGALGKFIEAVEKGIVKSGSYLLVESLDRLSRENVPTALQMFLNLINRGITIVTLADEGRVYSKASLQKDFTELIISIVIMSRAHEESKRKAGLVAKGWAKKRKDAAETGKVYTKVTPFWLQMKPDRSGYEVIPQHAATVMRMFQLSLDGFGVFRIEETLNEEGRFTASGKRWRSANVAKVLHNPAVIGKAHFAEGNDNYWPAIIDEATFYQVQKGMESRNRLKTAGGKQHTLVRNLFKGLLKCPYCGSSLVVVSGFHNTKDHKKISGKVVCQSKRYDKSKCTFTGFDYFVFQRWVLSYLSELNVGALLSTSNSAETELHVAIAQAQAKVDDIARRLQKMLAAIEESDAAPGPILKRIAELETESVIAENSLKQREAELEAHRGKSHSLELHQASIRELIAILNDPESSPGIYVDRTDEEEMLRTKLMASIRNIVKGIRLYSNGMPSGMSADPDTLAGILKLDQQPYYATIDFGNCGGRLLLPDGVGANWAITDSEGTRTAGIPTTEKSKKSPKNARG